MNAFCMLCGSDAFRFTRMAVESALKHLEFDHAFLAYPERRVKQNWPSKIRAMFPDRIKVHTVPGADRWDDVAKVRFGLFDLALEEGIDGWLFSLDDDDVIIGSPSLSGLDARIGMFHSDILAVCQQPTGHWQTGDVFVRDAGLIHERIDANMFRGSFYGYRAAAWDDVRGDVDRAYTDYEEWRTVWHMLRMEWKDHYFPHVMQVQRVQDFVTAISTQRDKGRSWAMTYGLLESKFRTEGSDRYWQNWDHDEKCNEVEDFWRNDPNQVARREHFYQIIRENVLPQTKNMQLLDFGCGVCWDKPAIETMKYQYFGADITKEMLDKARQKFPDVNVFLDDILDSGFSDEQWPVVNCSAVIPHLPKEVHQTAIDTLWRITSKCLIIRLFGVDTFPDDTTSIIKGFLYNRFTEQTWCGYFTTLSPVPKSFIVYRGNTKATEDIMIAVIWK